MHSRISRRRTLWLPMAVLVALVLCVPPASAASTWVGPKVAGTTQSSALPSLVPAGSDLVLGYWATDSSYAYQRLVAGQWTARRTVATDVVPVYFDQVAVAADARTARFVIPFQVGAVGRLRYVVHNGTAITQSVVLGEGSVPMMTLSRDGTTTVIAWSQGRIKAWQISAAGVVNPPTTVANERGIGRYLLTAGPDTFPLVVWAQETCNPSYCTSPTRSLAYSWLSGTGWSGAARVPTGGTDVGPTALTSNSFTSLLVFNHASDVNHVTDDGTYSITYRGGGRWAAPETVSSGGRGGNAALSFVGDAIVVSRDRTMTKTMGSTWQSQPAFPRFPLYCDENPFPPVAYVGRVPTAVVAPSVNSVCTVESFQLTGS